MAQKRKVNRELQMWWPETGSTLAFCRWWYLENQPKLLRFGIRPALTLALPKQICAVHMLTLRKKEINTVTTHTIFKEPRLYADSMLWFCGQLIVCTKKNQNPNLYNSTVFQSLTVLLPTLNASTFLLTNDQSQLHLSVHSALQTQGR